MQLDHLMIAIVVVSMITLGYGAFATDAFTRYGIATTPQFNAQFNRLNETYALTEDIATNIKGASAEQGTSSDFDIGKTIIAALSAIKNVFVQGIPAIFSTITGLGNYIPLPEWAIRGLQTIMIIAVAFSLIYLYFRYKGN